MYKRLQDALSGKEENCLYPFFWLKMNHKDSVITELDRIEKSGAKAFCLEARPYPEFASEGWFSEMDIIMEEAEKRGMQLWLLDDDHFPTGHCAGKSRSVPSFAAGR